MTIFHATLNNLAAITAVLVGTGTGAVLITSPINHFVPGYSGQGVRFNSKDDYLGYQESDGTTINWPGARGELSFWMKPLFLDGNTEKLTFFQRGPWLSAGMLEFGKHATANNNTFRLITIDAEGVRTDSEIAQPDWAAQLEKGQWTHVRITWDWNSAEGVQCYHVYLNGVDMPFVRVSQGATVLPGPLTGKQSYVPANVGQYFYLGSRGPGSVFRANMDADELMLTDGS